MFGGIDSLKSIGSLTEAPPKLIQMG